MDKRNINLIATVLATVFCGCPGLLGLCFGATSVLASFTPGAEIDVFGSSDPGSATTMGFLAVCLSLIAIAMPFVVWFATYRKRLYANPPVSEPAPPVDESIR
jgi:hypothetical protein